MNATVEMPRVPVTQEMVREIVVVQPDGRVTTAELVGLVRWSGRDLLTYTVREQGE